jgi:hypothetical protein
MKVDINVLRKALNDMNANEYSGEKLLHTEIDVQSEDIQGEKLGDILTVKVTISKVDKYNNNRESTIVKILEIPGECEGQGKKYSVTTQTVDKYDLDNKE